MAAHAAQALASNPTSPWGTTDATHVCPMVARMRVPAAMLAVLLSAATAHAGTGWLVWSQTYGGRFAFSKGPWEPVHAYEGHSDCQRDATLQNRIEWDDHRKTLF